MVSLMKNMSNRRTRYVSGSEIGATVYCPRSYYYQINGIAGNNAGARLRGNMAHEQMNREVKMSQVRTSLFKRLMRWLLNLFIGHKN